MKIENIGPKSYYVDLDPPLQIYIFKYYWKNYAIKSLRGSVTENRPAYLTVLYKGIYLLTDGFNYICKLFYGFEINELFRWNVLYIT